MQNVSRFLEIKLEIYELKLKNQLSGALANVAVLLIVLSFGFVGIVFLSFALGLYLNSVLESNFAGLLIIGILYLIAGYVAYRVKDKFIAPRILQAMFKEDFKELENGQEETNEEQY